LDKTLELVSKQTLSTEVFVRENSEDNVLYTCAINEGLRKFCFNNAHDFVLLLNHDAYLAPDCLERMLQVMNKNPKCGIVTPVAIDMHGQVTWAGGLEAYPWGAHYCPPLENLITPEIETPWANGACMLLRVSMIHEIGLLDENMRFICSDSDYSFTARARGWLIFVATQALMVHQPHSSRGESEDTGITEIMLKDQLYFSEKWLTGEVYKRLAIEGPKLNAACVASFRHETQKTLDLLQSTKL
jgi:GT2 family glycosyltransferase